MFILERNFSLRGEILLRVNNINVFYGEIQALWNVSLEIKEGEFTGVIGANGAGKTTLLRTISGLLKIKSGGISFRGEKIDNSECHLIVQKGISLVPEGRMLFPYMSVMENLEMGAFTVKSKEKIDETLELVFQLFPRLKERKDQRAGTLSGGEQQMLAIGRGLMSNPKLLMLDEPSLGLAPKLIIEVLNVLKKIHEEGITLLLVEQNVQHTLDLVERAYLLENGRVTMESDAKSLKKSEIVKKKYLGL